MLLIQIVLQHLLLNKQLMLYDKIIENVSHSTYQQIETILGISSTPINLIIDAYLNLRKVCARWVPAYTNR